MGKQRRPGGAPPAARAHVRFLPPPPPGFASPLTLSRRVPEPRFSAPARPPGDFPNPGLVEEGADATRHSRTGAELSSGCGRGADGSSAARADHAVPPRRRGSKVERALASAGLQPVGSDADTAPTQTKRPTLSKRSMFRRVNDEN